MRRSAILVPLSNGTVGLREGNVAWFNIDGKRHKLFLQRDRDGDICSLVHYASGQIIADLSGRIMQNYITAGRKVSFAGCRIIAEQALRHIIEKHGVGKVLACFSAAPVLNK